ncbi:hypothetical protein [Sphingosinicella sp.]|uniref:hypothetical protein n=1 Tax=Sphingosinicella sp. TaxID=1917971 RepID=UPI0040378890
MRELIALILLALLLIAFTTLAVVLRRRANHARWFRRGHADYSKVRPRRGLFG